MRNYLVLAGFPVLCFLVACGSADATTQDGASAEDEPSFASEDGTSNENVGVATVHGTLAESSLIMDNARVIAVAPDQTRFWTYLTKNGEFTLKLPVGHSYRIIFANQLKAGGQVKFGHLNVETTNGTTAWLGANQAGSLELGNVSLNREGAAKGEQEVNNFASDEETEETDGQNHGDDECHKDDSLANGNDGSANKTPDQVDVCDAAANKPFFPSKKPGAEWNDKNNEDGKPNAAWDDDKACTDGGNVGNACTEQGGDNGGGWSTGPGGWGSSSDERPQGGMNGGGGWGTGTGSSGGWGGTPGNPSVPNQPKNCGPKPPVDGGWMPGQSNTGGGTGTACVTAADCTANLACIGGVCQARPR